jgi:hypothetical protein
MDRDSEGADVEVLIAEVSAVVNYFGLLEGPFVVVDVTTEASCTA